MREEAKVLEPQGKIRGLVLYLDQMCGEGHNAGVNSQVRLDEHTLSLYNTVQDSKVRKKN